MESFNQSIIKHKTGLLNLAAELGDISKVAVSWAFPVIRSIGIRQPEMPVALRPCLKSAAENPISKTGVEEAIEQAVVEFATAFPAHGQVRASNELRKRGVFVSPSGVHIWCAITFRP